MNHGKIVPWAFEVSGLRCAEEVFVFEVVSGRSEFDDDGMVGVDELLFLCARDVLEEVVCVGVARMMSKVHVLVREDEEFIELCSNLVCGKFCVGKMIQVRVTTIPSERFGWI